MRKMIYEKLYIPKNIFGHVADKSRSASTDTHTRGDHFGQTKVTFCYPVPQICGKLRLLYGVLLWNIILMPQTEIFPLAITVQSYSYVGSTYHNSPLGKSLNIDMLQYFFKYGYDSKLFEGLTFSNRIAT